MTSDRTSAARALWTAWIEAATADEPDAEILRVAFFAAHAALPRAERVALTAALLAETVQRCGWPDIH